MRGSASIHRRCAERHDFSGVRSLLLIGPASLLLIHLQWADVGIAAAVTIAILSSRWGPRSFRSLPPPPSGFCSGVRRTHLGRVGSRWDFFCVVGTHALASCGTPGPRPRGAAACAGARVGRGVVLDGRFAEDLPDPDMITIEDGATVEGMFRRTRSRTAC
jgi:hypothetical protein